MCWARSGFKLFAYVISRRQKSPLAGIELILCFCFLFSDPNEIQNPSSSTPRAKRQCVDSCIEHHLVASIAKSASRLKQGAAEDLDFDLDTVNKGSIIIQLKPKSAESWKKLENNCLTGKIKDFIPKVYKDEAIYDLLKDGEYRLKFTIYTLPGFSQLEHTGEGNRRFQTMIRPNNLGPNSLQRL